MVELLNRIVFYLLLGMKIGQLGFHTDPQATSSMLDSTLCDSWDPVHSLQTLITWTFSGRSFSWPLSRRLLFRSHESQRLSTSALAFVL